MITEQNNKTLSLTVSHIPTICSIFPSVLRGEDLYGLQQVEGQTVLSVVLRQYLDQTTDQPAGLGQRDQGTPQLTWVLQNKPHFQLKMTRWFI